MMTEERASSPPKPMEAEAEAEASAGGETSFDVLHVSSSPIRKAWGSQRLLRLLNVKGNGQLVSHGWRSVVVGYRGSEARQPRFRTQEADGQTRGKGRGLDEVRAKLLVKSERRRRAPEEEEDDEKGVERDDGGLGEARAKLIIHVRETVDRMQEKRAEAEPLPGPENERKPSSASDAERPWNLRTRSAAGRAAQVSVLAETGDMARTERPKFSISLTTEEIAEDIYAVTGFLPRRRPRKRARIVQKQLDVR